MRVAHSLTSQSNFKFAGFTGIPCEVGYGQPEFLTFNVRMYVYKSGRDSPTYSCAHTR